MRLEQTCRVFFSAQFAGKSIRLFFKKERHSSEAKARTFQGLNRRSVFQYVSKARRPLHGAAIAWSGRASRQHASVTPCFRGAPTGRQRRWAPKPRASALGYARTAPNGARFLCSRLHCLLPAFTTCAASFPRSRLARPASRVLDLRGLLPAISTCMSCSLRMDCLKCS